VVWSVGGFVGGLLGVCWGEQKRCARLLVPQPSPRPLSPTQPNPTPRINLRENELESAGAAIIARALPTLPALQSLDLAGNQMGRGGALAVVRALVAGGRASFTRLVLDENYLTDDAVDAARDLLSSALGGDGCLSVEDLDPGAAEDEDEGEDEGMDDGAGDELAAALAKAQI